MASGQTAEERRLEEDARRDKNWKRWGPYLSQRQWGTVREDYSPNGDAWNYITHDDARSRAYRWGEDGLLGWTDRECRLCFAVALWNGRDPILKERLFGLSNTQGNHGEDVKECYYYLAATPTHSYARALYKYPQDVFPYARLVEENARRTRQQPEFELEDTGIFLQNRYFDVLVEYAKASPDDTLIRLTVANRGPETVTLHVLPTLWFRNSWVWGCRHEGCEIKPSIALDPTQQSEVVATHVTLGTFRLAIDEANLGLRDLPVRWLFTENETNTERLFKIPNEPPFVKDAFHQYLVDGKRDAVNPASRGTKATAPCVLTLSSGAKRVIRLRLAPSLAENPFSDFDALFAERIQEMDAFYATKISSRLKPQQREIVLQAYAGLLWCKQFYFYVVEDWLEGDPNMPPPPPFHAELRNTDWRHLFSRDVVSMPDNWEYPWFAAWDLAFHMLPFARIDSEFAKNQLMLFLREWYMHPNGQMAAYEWNFCDVNPPVHAWACWRVYKIAGCEESRDRLFLERCFQKLLMNFTWWVNRKDIAGKHIFAGGFLGLDNIGLFDRSKPLPGGERLEQADGTAWMAFYCGTMLSMAMELARTNPAYEDIASKFFEHFIGIVDAMNAIGAYGLWNEEDGFYYDQALTDGQMVPLRVRSIVGLIPLLAVEVLRQSVVEKLPGFCKRLHWFVENRKDLAGHISCAEHSGAGQPRLRLLSIASCDRLIRVLRYVLDEAEFLSPYGLRSLSKVYEEAPYSTRLGGHTYCIGYEPGESGGGMFGGNSNWRGPIWFPINYLFIEALERYHHFYGDRLKVECPTGSGIYLTLAEVARELTRRLASLFEPDTRGRRPIYGEDAKYAEDPHWRNLVLFHEYFNADTGRGLGASHQTGWTALATRIFSQ